MLEVVIAAPSRDYLTAMVFPNVPVLRAKFKAAGETYSEDTKFLQDDAVLAFSQSLSARVLSFLCQKTLHSCSIKNT
jgi:hypothetical protein